MHENTETRRVANTLAVAKKTDLCPCSAHPRYIVVPAGIGFFHITEFATGQVRGFRRHHGEACALAHTLEAASLAQPA
nr:hypothetical protein [Pseudomonas aegrilactucae]